MTTNVPNKPGFSSLARMSLMAIVRPESVAQTMRCLNQLDPLNFIAILDNQRKGAVSIKKKEKCGGDGRTVNCRC